MIGNYVKCDWRNEIYEVVELDYRGMAYIKNVEEESKIEGLDCLLKGVRRINPIPITIDWLVKNGFKKEYEELCYSKEIDGYYIDITFGLSNRSEGHIACHVDNNDRQTVGCADILYIHQLQNLLNILNIKEQQK